MVYCNTDSAFISPSRIVGEVASALAQLSPYAVEVPFLKDETAEGAPAEEYPLGSTHQAPRFYGISSKRYCLFARGRDGSPHVFREAASDRGLGSYQVGENRKEGVAELWERISKNGEAAAEDYLAVAATAEFSLSAPNFLPRVRQLGDLRPFTFLTARLLEASRDPNEIRSELVAFVGPKDDARRAALMAKPRQRSWESVVEAFARHRGRKCTFDSEGQMVRRSVLVKENRIQGIGKEANRIESARVLGQAAVGAARRPTSTRTRSRGARRRWRGGWR